jgi:hypothetical protein
MESENRIDDVKRLIKIMFIYRALENGWTVKKSDSIKNAFEFTTSMTLGKHQKCTPNIYRRRAVSVPTRHIN